MEPIKIAEPQVPTSNEWQELRGHVRHQAVEVLRLIAILVQDAVILLAGFLAEFAYEHWLHSEHPFFQYAISISSAVFLLLYVVTVTVHVVHYVRGQFSTTPAGVMSQLLLTRLLGRERLAWSVTAVAIVGMAAMVIPTLRHAREVVPDAPETRVDIVTPATEDPASFALAPDGRQIVFVASGDGASRLWLRSLSAATAQPLAGTEGARYPFWSPDSRSVGFFAANALKRLDLSGGAPQTLAPVVAGRGGTWSAEGIIVFGTNGATGLMRVAATGGAPAAITTVGPQQSSHRWPQFLPDGGRFLFHVPGSETGWIYLGALDGRAPTRLVTADRAAVLLPTGWLLWGKAGSVVSQRFDVAKGALSGEPVTLASGITLDSGLGATSGQPYYSAAATGLVAYRMGGPKPRQLTWLDRSGAVRGTVGDPDVGNLLDPRVSPDGRRVVVTRTLQGNQDLWLLDGARASRLTFDTAEDTRPVWSPDGTRIAFLSYRTGPGDLYQKITSAVGVDEPLIASDQRKIPTSWSADGRFLLYFSIDPQTQADLWVLPLVGNRKPWVFLKTPFRELSGVFSPDGRWVAYQSDESGRPEIYLRPFLPPAADGTDAGTAGSQWQVSTAGGISPVWRPDGKELYYLNPAGAMMAAPVTVTGSTMAPGTPVQLFPTRVYGGGVDVQQRVQYDVAPDGRFLINTVLDAAATPPITLLQNWRTDAKK